VPVAGVAGSESVIAESAILRLTGALAVSGGMEESVTVSEMR
jgi:hypothetical protein